MTRDVQLPEPAAALLDAVVLAAPGWFRRIVTEPAAAAGIDAHAFADRLDELVAAEVPRLVAAMTTLLATDVDRQHTNPLSLLRAAVAAPTALLAALGVPAPVRDGFASDHFPDDRYGLCPATWSDVDPALHEPGLTWGAWKAMTVLRRRRAEAADRDEDRA